MKGTCVYHIVYGIYKQFLETVFLRFLVGFVSRKTGQSITSLIFDAILKNYIKKHFE